MTALWEALIPTAVGAAATVLGVYMGAVVGRRNQDRQWIRDKKTVAYETFLQEFTAVEIELRQAYLVLPDFRFDDDGDTAAAVGRQRVGPTGS